MKKTILVILIGVIIIGGLIYWYEIRPAMIRNQCNSSAWEKIQEFTKSVYDVKAFDVKNVYDLFYNACIRNKGLNK